MDKQTTSVSSLQEQELALFGGPHQVLVPLPHEVWPPLADADELSEIAAQRNLDIGIAGRRGPIGALEEEFLAFLQNEVRFAVTFNSGTSALLAAYFALGVDEDTEVIGPALTYHAALSPARILRGLPVLVDIKRDTRCIDETQIERQITDRTKVITVVHQWGHAAEMDAIMPIADKYNLMVLEDCSHAHGSRYKGRLCGTFGHAAVFSLQTAKMIFAGEGGIMVTNSAHIHDRATLLGHYRDRSREEVLDPELRQLWVTGYGLKLRMSPFNAIVARHSLAAYPERKRGRHACLTYFTERLRDVPFIEAHLPGNDIDMGAWYGFKPLYLPERLGGLSRAVLIEALQAEGLDISVPSGPVLSTLPLYSAEYDCLFAGGKKMIPQRASNHPIAMLMERQSISLPTFYTWPADRSLIDQYVSAFQKVELHSDRLHEYETMRSDGKP